MRQETLIPEKGKEIVRRKMVHCPDCGEEAIHSYDRWLCFTSGCPNVTLDEEE